MRIFQLYSYKYIQDAKLLNCYSMVKYCMMMLLLFVFRGVLFAQTPSCIPVLNFEASNNNICLGTTVTFHATVKNPGTNEVFKWLRNGVSAGVSGADYTASNFHDSDVINCEYSCRSQCGNDTTVNTPGFLLYVIDDVKPIVYISSSNAQICEGSSTVFTAQASYGNAIPSYQWLVNDELAGTNTPTYTTNSLTNGAEVECILTTLTPGCLSTQSSSAQLTIQVYPMLNPTIKIAPSRTNICRGEQVVFTTTASGGSFPSFAWEINGIPTGDTNDSLVTSTLRNGDSVSCTITVDPNTPCYTTVSATSNKVGIQVIDFESPTVTIASSDIDVCEHDSIRFSATAQNTGDDNYFQWMVNDKYAGDGSPYFNYNKFANGDKVSCMLTTNIPACSDKINVISDAETVTIKPAPVISFALPQISILTGESAQLNATVSGSISSVAWQPESAVIAPQSLTTTSIPLIHDTVFSLTVADTHGCTSSRDLLVKVFYKLYLPSAFTPNNDGRNDVFRIPPATLLTLSQLFVFDRCGNVIFKTTDISKGWNGTYRGKPVHAGIYIYVIEGYVEEQPLVVKGTVTLLR